MSSTRSKAPKILVISLSNIGDVVLTCPAIDVILHDFPEASIDVVVGLKAASLFAGHERIRVIIFEKNLTFDGIVDFILPLRKTHYDMIIDFRQTMFPLLLRGKIKTPLWAAPFRGHSRLKHLKRLNSIYPVHATTVKTQAIKPLPVAALTGSKYVVIAPGSASSDKRWPAANFIALANALLARHEEIV